MGTYLLVAHQTAHRHELFEAARELAAADPDARFTLLVPATPARDLLTWEEGQTRNVATRRAALAADALRARGINVVDQRIGDKDPVLAVGDEFLDGRRYEAIVLSTLPVGISRWIKMDVVSRLQRAHPRVRVVHVVSEAPELDAGTARSA
jgi:hypothetical protein